MVWYKFTEEAESDLEAIMDSILSRPHAPRGDAVCTALRCDPGAWLAISDILSRGIELYLLTKKAD